MSEVNGEILCNDCGGWDSERMSHCSDHGADYCRGCSCPECEEDKTEDCDREMLGDDADLLFDHNIGDK